MTTKETNVLSIWQDIVLTTLPIHSHFWIWTFVTATSNPKMGLEYHPLTSIAKMEESFTIIGRS